MAEISLLVGQTLSNVRQIDNEQIVFETEAGKEYRMYHEQDCCETVTIEDVVGDLSNLVGSPILVAEEISSSEGAGKSKYTESHTWTYYKLATVKGHVDIRWYGESNGYYSEGVDFYEFDERGNKVWKH